MKCANNLAIDSMSKLFTRPKNNSYTPIVYHFLHYEIWGIYHMFNTTLAAEKNIRIYQF